MKDKLPRPDAHLNVTNLNHLRPRVVRTMIAQASFQADQWEQHHGLCWLRDVSSVRAWIHRIQDSARLHTVDMVVFPELSIPVDYIPQLQHWSAETGVTIIAGSHYHTTGSHTVSRCPVIIAGDIFFIEKLNPSPLERSPVSGEGLSPGTQLSVFLGSPVGNLGVLICSDYLAPALRGQLFAVGLDLLCVPSFQRDSSNYHERMHIDCEENDSGVYIAYANCLCNGLGDGHTACFGVMDRIFLDKLRSATVTDGQPPTKVCQLHPQHEAMIVDLDLSAKRPTVPHTLNTSPNITIVTLVPNNATPADAFASAVAHNDERYRNIEALYVPPVEFNDIISRLEAKRLVFIIGDPGIGKTYTAAMLLKQYFDQGYHPIWFTGLEREERLLQRQVLETFRPRDKDIVYFEDPFGRTVFEKRDAILQVFRPLMDILKDVDARVIVSSRRDVFERFSKESLIGEELCQFREDMSIIKPSYSHAALGDVLERLAVGRCKWYLDLSARSVVLSAIEDGILATPLAIRDLVCSTEEVREPNELAARVSRRHQESTLTFTEDLQGVSAEQKLLLLLVCLFGYKHQGTLIPLFSAAAREVAGTDVAPIQLPCLEVIRSELGYRIEQYGSPYPGLRFTHPMYEEALTEFALRDHVMKVLTGITLRFAVDRHLGMAVTSAARHAGKYPRFTVMLLQVIVQCLRERPIPKQLLLVGVRLIALFDRHWSQDVADLLARICTTDEIVAAINSVSSMTVLLRAFRFAVNRDKRLQIGQPSAMGRDVDWPDLFQRLRAGTFAEVVGILEWASWLNPTVADEYLSHSSEPVIIRSLVCASQRELPGWVDRLSKLASPDNVRRVSELSKMVPHYSRMSFETLCEDLSIENAIVVDDGAANAIMHRRSLLPCGVIEVRGEFPSAVPCRILRSGGELVAFGLPDYDSEEVDALRGYHSSQIAEVVGKYVGAAIVRRSALFWPGKRRWARRSFRPG